VFMKRKMIFMMVFILLFTTYTAVYSYDINWGYTEWTSETNSTVYDGVDIYTDDAWDTNYDSPNVTSSTNLNYPNQTSSAEATLLPDNPGYIHTYVDNALSESYTYSSASADLSFTGDFTAEYPYLVIDYSYSYNIYAQGRDNNADATNSVFISICVFDYTSFSPLFGCPSGEFPFYLMNDEVGVSGIGEDSSSGSDSGIINIPVEIGHYIGVDIRGSEYAFASGNARAGSSSMYADFSLYASHTVVPEPVSSVLFIIGGGILGGRLFVKKKNC